MPLATHPHLYLHTGAVQELAVGADHAPARLALAALLRDIPVAAVDDLATHDHRTDTDA